MLASARAHSRGAESRRGHGSECRIAWPRLPSPAWPRRQRVSSSLQVLLHALRGAAFELVSVAPLVPWIVGNDPEIAMTARVRRSHDVRGKVLQGAILVDDRLIRLQ